VSGNGISWAICKSAPCSSQITMPVLHHSVFTCQMPFLPPSQQCQSTEGTSTACKHTHTQPFNGRWSGTTQVGQYQKKHSHPSWSSDILYQLPPFTTIHSILCVQFTCFTVLFNKGMNCYQHHFYLKTFVTACKLLRNLILLFSAACLLLQLVLLSQFIQHQM